MPKKVAFYLFSIILHMKNLISTHIFLALTLAMESIAMRPVSSVEDGPTDRWVSRDPTHIPAMMASSTRWTTRRIRMVSRPREPICPFLHRFPLSQLGEIFSIHYITIILYISIKYYVFSITQTQFLWGWWLPWIDIFSCPSSCPS